MSTGAGLWTVVVNTRATTKDPFVFNSDFPPITNIVADGPEQAKSVARIQKPDYKINEGEASGLMRIGVRQETGYTFQS